MQAKGNGTKEQVNKNSYESLDERQDKKQIEKGQENVRNSAKV